MRTTTLPEIDEARYLEVSAQHPSAHVCGGCFTPYATVAEAFACQCPEIDAYVASVAGRSSAEGDGAGPRFPEKPGKREAARRASVGDNVYGGSCTQCGAWVDPLEGKRSKADGRWVVRHLACPETGTAAPGADEPHVVPACNVPAAPAKPNKPNRYAAPCVRCGVTVAAGAGNLRKDGARWVVEHLDCPTEPVVTTHDGPRGITATVEIPRVPEGHYAIPSTGDNDLAFYRVDHGTGEWAGRVFVKRIIGGRPDSNVPRAHVPGILARIAEDPEAGPRYGREIGRCCRCNRHLTDDASREAGIGPDCATKD